MVSDWRHKILHFSVSLHSVPGPRFPECRTLRHSVDGVCALHSNWRGEGGGRGGDGARCNIGPDIFSSDLSYVMSRKVTKYI